MSTLRMRLLCPRRRRIGPFVVVFGLAVCQTLAGCSSTGPGLGLRTGAASKSKTYLAVGDKPLPVVGGEPGDTVAVGDDEPTVSAAPNRPEARISGRVYDANGRPVPKARVRLAVSGAPGGKLQRVVTDASGGFTIHGLRPGTDYTVVAEAFADDGLQTGRARASASQTDVRISLAPAAGEGQGTAAAPGTPRINVNKVSDQDVDDETDEASTPEVGPGSARGKARGVSERSPTESTGQVNEEDLPPAPEAEALAPPRAVAAGAAGDARWRRGTARRADESANDAPVDADARGTAGVNDGPTVEAPVDEGPNPLPPALEPGSAPRRRAPVPASIEPSAAAGRASDAPAEFGGDPFADAPAQTASAGKGRGGSRAQAGLYDSPSRPTVPPASAPARLADAEDRAPGALVVTPETFGPVVLADDRIPEPAPRTAAVTPDTPRRPRPTPAPPRATRPAPRPAPADSTDDSASSGTLPAPVEAEPGVTVASATRLAPPPVIAMARETKHRPTWAEVGNAALPPLEGEPAPAPVERASTTPEGSTRAAAALASKDAAGDDPAKPLCDYDDRHRRVVDFRLPGLDGKPVRFSDVDADLILLDFWGTWCQPCIRSVPHLVELQAKNPGKRLKVIGIACEPEAAKLAAPKVAAKAASLKLNYPVLLSCNDGSCPLQEALHVQALPTMILLDRQGRVLWRDQGATPATLARLDHMVAAATSDGAVRR